MPVEVWVALITLGGVALGLLARPVQDYLQSKWQTERDHAERRWSLEWDSLVELQALVEGFAIRDDADRTLERDKVHAAGLGARVRDNRVRLAVDPLLATRVGSQEWRDDVSTVTRKVGEVLREM